MLLMLPFVAYKVKRFVKIALSFGFKEYAALNASIAVSHRSDCAALLE